MITGRWCEIEPAMNCDMCGKPGASVREITETCEPNDTTILIEGVPAVVCPRCGESYVTAQTASEIDRIRANWRELTVPREVPVARFGR
jgi:YgiT-type zinc finger domain-containing protein